MLLDDEARPGPPASGRADPSSTGSDPGPARSRHPVPGTARLALARDLLHAGRVHEARSALERLLPTSTDLLVRAATRGALTEALLAQGELRAAATLLDGAAAEGRARRRSPEGPRPAPGSAAQRALAHDVHAAGELAAARGDTQEASVLHRRAGQLVAGAGPGGDAIADPPWRVGAALALGGCGRTREARRLAAEHREDGERTGSAYDVGLSLRVLAVLDPSGRQEPLLREAREVLSSVGARRAVAQVDADVAGLLLLGAAGPLVGRPDDRSRGEAVRLLLDVERYARAEGLWPLLGRAGRLLELTGGVPGSGSWHGLGLLTPAERRVVEPAAAGATNREIATRLGLSVKAVEWHLSRAYRKLGITSRRALVDALGRPHPTPAAHRPAPDPQL